MVESPASQFTKNDVPRKRDLLKAFDSADTDGCACAPHEPFEFFSCVLALVCYRESLLVSSDADLTRGAAGAGLEWSTSMSFWRSTGVLRAATLTASPVLASSTRPRRAARREAVFARGTTHKHVHVKHTVPQTARRAATRMRLAQG